MKILKNYKFRTKEIKYGWGVDGTALEFPYELAINCFMKLKLYENMNTRDAILHDYCLDVINNHREGNDTYILANFWGMLIEMAENIIYKKKNNK